MTTAPPFEFNVRLYRSRLGLEGLQRKKDAEKPNKATPLAYSKRAVDLVFRAFFVHFP